MQSDCCLVSRGGGLDCIATLKRNNAKDSALAISSKCNPLLIILIIVSLLPEVLSLVLWWSLNRFSYLLCRCFVVANTIPICYYFVPFFLCCNIIPGHSEKYYHKDYIYQIMCYYSILASCLLTQFWFSLFCKWTINLPLLFNQKLRFNDLYTPNFLLHRNLAKPHNTHTHTLSLLLFLLYYDEHMMMMMMMMMCFSMRPCLSRLVLIDPVGGFSSSCTVTSSLSSSSTSHSLYIQYPVTIHIISSRRFFVISTFGCCCCSLSLWLYSKVSLF